MTNTAFSNAMVDIEVIGDLTIYNAASTCLTVQVQKDQLTQKNDSEGYSTRSLELITDMARKFFCNEKTDVHQTTLQSMGARDSLIVTQAIEPPHAQVFCDSSNDIMTGDYWIQT